MIIDRNNGDGACEKYTMLALLPWSVISVVCPVFWYFVYFRYTKHLWLFHTSRNFSICPNQADAIEIVIVKSIFRIGWNIRFYSWHLILERNCSCDRQLVLIFYLICLKILCALKCQLCNSHLDQIFRLLFWRCLFFRVETCLWIAELWHTWTNYICVQCTWSEGTFGSPCLD